MTVRRTFETQADPASGKFLVVTPNDSADLPFTTRALIVGTSGAVTVVSEDGDTVVLPAMGAAYRFDVRVNRVLATGTAGSNILAIY